MNYLQEMVRSFMSRQQERTRLRWERLRYSFFRFRRNSALDDVRNSAAARRDLHRAYEPKPYDGRVTVFVGERTRHMGDYVDGWKRLATGGVEVHVVPGSHTDMLREPGVKQLAAQLQALLDRECGSAGIHVV